MRFILIALVVVVLSAPSVVLALDPLVPCNGPDCQACSFVKLGQNILDFLVMISVFIAGLVFAWGGLMMATSGGDTGKVTKAKEMFTNAIIGLFILLAAWLVIDTVMKVLYKQPTTPVGFGPWNNVKCVVLPSVYDGSLAPGSRGDMAGRYVNGVFVPGGPNGVFASEQVLGTGSCSPSYMQTLGWGAQAANASCICNKESGGVPGILSRTDRTADKQAFSVGLFQINLTVHDLEGCGPSGSTLKCTSAFNGTNYKATVSNTTLYKQCVAAAADGACANRNAQRIQQSRGSWQDWSTASACRL